MGFAGPKMKCWEAMLPLEALEGSLPSPFQLLDALCTPWLVTPSSFFKSGSIASSNLSLSLSACAVTSPFLHSDPPASLL